MNGQSAWPSSDGRASASAGHSGSSHNSASHNSADLNDLDLNDAETVLAGDPALLRRGGSGPGSRGGDTPKTGPSAPGGGSGPQPARGAPGDAGQAGRSGSPGWYPDPSGRGVSRYHDGTRWTQQIIDRNGRQTVDPTGFDGPPPQQPAQPQAAQPQPAPHQGAQPVPPPAPGQPQQPYGAGGWGYYQQGYQQQGQWGWQQRPSPYWPGMLTRPSSPPPSPTLIILLLAGITVLALGLFALPWVDGAGDESYTAVKLADIFGEIADYYGEALDDGISAYFGGGIWALASLTTLAALLAVFANRSVAVPARVVALLAAGAQIIWHLYVGNEMTSGSDVDGTSASMSDLSIGYWMVLVGLAVLGVIGLFRSFPRRLMPVPYGYGGYGPYGRPPARF